MSDQDNGEATFFWSSSRSTLDHRSTPDIGTTLVPPNVPFPDNRQIQNYRSTNRSFTRPYSAKTVFFYKDGDIYFSGVRVPVSKARYRTIESLLDDLNSNISMPFGVRHLTTPSGKTMIKNIDQLQHHGRYIASSFKTPRPLNLSMVEKIQRIRHVNRSKMPNCYRNNCSNDRKLNENGPRKIPLKLSFEPITSKQMLFVLNGKPSRIYRALLNPFRKRSMESLLEEISEGLQIAIFKLYTYSGKRITSMDEIFSLNEVRLLAVPRNEKPVFRKNVLSTGIPQLPPISKTTPPTLPEQPSTAKQLLESVYRDNSIERPQRMVNNHKMMSLTSMSRLTGRKSNESSNPSSKNKMDKFPERDSQHLPPISPLKRSPEVCEKETVLKNVENYGDERNEHADNDIRASESYSSKQMELHSEQETEDVKKNEKEEEENEVNRIGSENEESAREELVQNNLKIGENETVDEHHDEVGEQQRNIADTVQNEANRSESEKEEKIPESTLSTSSDQAFDNSETMTIASEADLPITTREDTLYDENSTNMTYTVSVITGNRWAADTDLDLFIILYGDLNESEKHQLRQENDESKFRQNKTSSFYIETRKLGLLQKIVIGHDHIGYGIGVYIERILVTENIDDGRQYLFQCGKWLDSGQVDGKIERTLKTTAYCYLTTILDGSKSTSGRWEFILHSGKDDGTGATTSNLNIVGYGSRGSSMTTKIYDNRMAKVPSASLVQVDFGDIGDLLKVRIEIDGNGDMPHYFLNYAELKDLDTEERMVSYVGKWLKIGCDEKNAQPFREFPVFRPTFEPLNGDFCLLYHVFKRQCIYRDVERKIRGDSDVLHYEAEIEISPRKQLFLEDFVAYMRIFGEIGETGYFPVDFRSASNLKKKVSFKTEAVSVGRIQSTRLYLKMNDIGSQIYEGMQMLQEIYDRQHVANVAVANNWIAEKITIRESHHAPYRYVMALNRLKTTTKVNEKINEDVCYDMGNVFMELLLSGMEGLSTKISKKKAMPKKLPQWILTMTIGEGSKLVPKVTLCTEKTSTEMIIDGTTPTDMIITFQKKATDKSMIIKVRIAIDDSQYLQYIPSKTKFSDEDIIEIQKMKLYDSENGDELRFPAVNTILTLGSVYEFPAVWPDIPPISNIVYIITVNSGESSADFDVYLTITGIKGDTGLRKLNNDDIDPFQMEKVSTFEMEAVSIGELLNITVVVRSENSSLKWKCEQVHILDSETNLLYIFKFNEMFTEKLKIQQISPSRVTDAL